LPKLTIFIISIILLVLGFFYYLIGEFNFSNVLQSSITSEFKTFSVAQIIQYPEINYSDGFSDTMKSRFETIRKYSSPSKFTHHLCNPIDENSNSWKSGNTCNDYKNKNPKFIKLNFNEETKLVLFTYYGLFSINEEENQVKWQSSHIDRFLRNNYTNCKFKFDPINIIPVKSDNKYYLYTTFSGLNVNSCLQFYDEENNSSSFSSSTNRLVLGYELNPSGELNRSYIREGVNYRSIGGIPFGPGPKNATRYANNPLQEILGCSKFDSSKNCEQVKGVIKNTRTTQSNGTPLFGKCLEGYEEEVDGYVRCAFCTTDTSYTSHTTTVCANRSGVDPSCGPNKTPGTSKTVDGVIYRMSGTDAKRAEWLDYTKFVCTSREIIGTTGAYFSASMSYPIFSKFTDFSLNRKNWNIQNSGQTPNDYTFYQNELDKESDIGAPLNFTSKLNNSVFTSNEFLFKLNISGTNIVVDRYNLSTKNYNLGDSSYIDSNSKVTKNIGKSSYSYFSLDYFGKDVYVMASSDSGFVFYKIKNFNDSTTNLDVVNLTTELSTKIPSNFGKPKSFGIIDNKIFVVTSNTVLYSEFSDIDPPEPPIDLSQYQNFEFNGNVYSRQNLGSGFIFSNLPVKYQGSFVTPNNIVSEYKNYPNSDLSFYYPITPPTSLSGFTNFNGQDFKKFNFMYKYKDAVENIPLNSSDYIELNPNSVNNFEIISISKGTGLKINLTNENILKNFNKYTLINLDKINQSRVIFTLDCENSNYYLICSGVKFNLKGSLLGQFFIQGKINPNMTNSRFIRIHENTDSIVTLFDELKKKKYPTVTSNIIYTKFD
jgi:hypothetical protein